MKAKPKAYCPICEQPVPGYEPKHCSFHRRRRRASYQHEIKDVGGRRISIGGKVKRSPGYE